MKKVLCSIILAISLTGAQAQWTQITSPYAGNMWAIKFFDQNNGYIGGNTAILKTTDGGDTWTSSSISVFSINSFSFPSSTVGYYGANNNIVAKTTDQGANWVNQDPNASPFAILSVSFPSTSVGYGVGNAGTIRKTTNGGTTWTTQSSGLSSNIQEVHFTDVNTGVCVGESGKIKRTTNGGSTWSNVTSGTTSNLYDIFFVDANNAYIAGGNGTILKTTNGGSSWTSLTSGTTQWLYSICFKNTMEGYAAGANGTILKTTNGGVTWTSEASGLSIQGINDIVYINDRFIAVADGGKILTTTASSSGIDESTADSPSFKLFPNPASELVAVQIDFLTDSSVELYVYDTNGALVRSETLTQTNHTLYLQDLAIGVYLVEIRTEERLIQKKLVIQK